MGIADAHRLVCPLYEVAAMVDLLLKMKLCFAKSSLSGDQDEQIQYRELLWFMCKVYGLYLKYVYIYVYA